MRRFFGAVEMVCGVVLMVGRENVADAANMALMGLLFFSLYANWALGEGLKEASHGIVLGLVLTCRFVIRLQVSLQKCFFVVKFPFVIKASTWEATWRCVDSIKLFV